MILIFIFLLPLLPVAAGVLIVIVFLFHIANIQTILLCCTILTGIFNFLKSFALFLIDFNHSHRQKRLNSTICGLSMLLTYSSTLRRSLLNIPFLSSVWLSIYLSIHRPADALHSLSLSCQSYRVLSVCLSAHDAPKHPPPSPRLYCNP